jgi:hypothetical protein
MEINKAGAERTGQTIWNAMAYSGFWESPEANPLFFISDEDLEKVIKKYKKNVYE